MCQKQCNLFVSNYFNREDEAVTYTVYECDKIKFMQAPENEVAVATGFTSARAAMDEANARRRANPTKSYTVG